MSEMTLKNRLEKDTKGSLVALLLLVIIAKQKETWGYQIKQILAEVTNSPPILDSTLYQALRALENIYGCLASQMKDRRRYYTITPNGIKQLQEAYAYWNELFTISNKAFAILDSSQIKKGKD